MSDPRLVSYLEAHGAGALVSADPGLVLMLGRLATEIATGPSPFQLPAVVVAPGDGPARLVCSADEAPEGEHVHAYEGFTVAPLRPADGAALALAEALAASGVRRSDVVYDAVSLPAALLPPLGGEARPAAGLDRLTAVKTAAEVRSIEAAIRLCDAGQAAARAALPDAERELDVWAAVAAAIEREAAARLPVMADVVSGERTADVGGPPSARRLRRADALLCDLVPRRDGYWADSCSTFFAGEPPEWARRMHAACCGALEAALGALRPGVCAGELDALVREALADEGLDYPHHTGHGVGFRWHEEPRIVPDSETAIEPGMVVALEPGAYVAGRHGLRVERVAVVTQDGCRVLSAHSLALEAAR